MKNLLLAVMMSAVSVMGAWAAPTVQVKGGETHLLFSTDMIDELALRGVESDAVEPASLRPDARKLRLRVEGGVLDLDTLAGEINHAGGIRLMSVDGQKLSLQSLRIDTMGESPMISAIATVSGSILSRIGLFELQRNESTEISLNERGTKLSIRNMDILLTTDGARYLNAYFGSAFEGGTMVGTASARIKLRVSSDDRPSRDDETSRDDSDSNESRDPDESRDSDNEGGLALG